ncbi:methyltransferase domain-containing protein [Nitrospira sp. T9]|uniref:class I SAM-dependent methyltransferase n=1 Tax=unclassified Nitrospira TaxID=2652172 RepID=UPI003F9A658D
MIPEETSYWESIADEWKKTRPDRLWRKHSDVVNQSLLLRWLPEQPAPRLLKTDTFDEAVGEGLVQFLQSRVHTVVGMDLSFQNVQLTCRGDVRIPGTCADVRNLPFGNELFDVVVSNSTLDHFQTSDEIIVSLRELHRVLRKDGQLILTLDNPANPIIAARNVLPFKLLNRLGILPYYVGATCGPWRLQKWLREIGFDVMDVTAVLHCPRIFAVLAAKILCSFANNSVQQRFLRWIQVFENMSRWPTRYLTGHFIAVRAEKR